MVRAKVCLVGWKRRSNWSAVELTFSPQYDGSIPEDQRFQRATPSGEFKMDVDNVAALARFQLGKFYYADFTPVEGPVDLQPATETNP